MIYSKKFDIAVVGAGVHGLSTCLYLAIKYPKLKFALFQQYKIGHKEGSSHSDIRIIRSTYFQEVYMKLCIQAIQKNWPQVEGLLKKQFIAPNQCLTYVQSQEQFKKIQKVASKSNGQIQLLSLPQVKKKYPNAPSIKTDFQIFLDKKAGIVYAERYLKSIVEFLEKYNNVTIYEEAQVIQLTNSLKSVKMMIKKGADKFQIEANRVSLSCGRWIGKIIPKMNKIVTQVRQNVGFWQMKEPQNYLPGKYPCWIFYGKDKRQYYSLPNVFNTGVKFAQHIEDSNHIKKFKDQNQYIKDQINHLTSKNLAFFDGKIQKLKKYEKCYYTVTKTEDFVIDWSDQNQNILIVSPCSGHGFKFGPIIGNIVADLLVEKSSINVYENFKNEFKIWNHLNHINQQQPRSKL